MHIDPPSQLALQSLVLFQQQNGIADPYPWNNHLPLEDGVPLPFALKSQRRDGFDLVVIEDHAADGRRQLTPRWIIRETMSEAGGIKREIYEVLSKREAVTATIGNAITLAYYDVYFSKGEYWPKDVRELLLRIDGRRAMLIFLASLKEGQAVKEGKEKISYRSCGIKERPVPFMGNAAIGNSMFGNSTRDIYLSWQSGEGRWIPTVARAADPDYSRQGMGMQWRHSAWTWWYPSPSLDPKTASIRPDERNTYTEADYDIMLDR